jgi:imidazolonepropionase-like amidohydrolase
MGEQFLRRTVIRNGTLIDGRGNLPVANGAIVLEAGLIKAVFSADETKAASPEALNRDAQVIDANGQFVLPGLIDGHVHLSMYQGSPAGIRYPTSAEYATLHAAQGIRATLRAGVTSISVPGGTWFVDVYVRDAVKIGMLEGPRIFCAGRIIGPYGSIGDVEPAWERGHQLAPDRYGLLCNTPDEYVVEVRRQHKHGVNMIKLMDTTLGDAQVLSRREIDAATEEAHRLNMPVCIHARGSGTIRAAALAGVDWIFHADFATEADLDAVAKAGIPIMPAFTQGQLWANLGEKFGVPADMRARLKSQGEIETRAIRNARNRGITILVGTDSGNGPPTGLGTCHGYEAEFLVKNVGLTALEAISAHTRDNSLVMGLEDKVGTIEVGKIADLIILDEDPIRNISVLGDPHHVQTIIKEGRIIDLNALTGPTLPVRATDRAA